MKNLNLIFRRTHLYLGLFLVSWFFVYAFSTWMLNHGPTFRQLRPGPDAWTQLWQRNADLQLPASQAELRAWAKTLLEEEDIAAGQFGVNRNAQRALITVQRFVRPIRLTYRFSDKMLIAEQRDASFVEALLRLHFRHGYGQGSVMQWIWGLIVDVVCFAFLIWVITGLYLWWKIPHTRKWGWVAIGAGVVSFVGLMISF